MICHSREAANDRVQRAQGHTLNTIAQLEDQQALLDGAAVWLPEAEAKLVRNVAERLRYVIDDLRSVDKILSEANKARRLRSEAARQPAAEDISDVLPA